MFIMDMSNTHPKVCSKFVNRVSRRSLKCTWSLSGKCLQSVLKMSERHLHGVWNIKGMCLGIMRKMALRSWPCRDLFSGGVWDISNSCLGQKGAVALCHLWGQNFFKSSCSMRTLNSWIQPLVYMCYRSTPSFSDIGVLLLARACGVPAVIVRVVDCWQ